CGKAAIPLQGRGNESEDEQVMDVLVIFTDNRPFLLQAVAPKTAQVTRAEKNGHRFPTPAAQQSIYANESLLIIDHVARYQ
ncbi:MAG: hypothetical protein IIY87_00380, partial [Bacteroidales bacterium]|nr:hypothetical protein [Bacteroidales bacterium]